MQILNVLYYLRADPAPCFFGQGLSRLLGEIDRGEIIEEIASALEIARPCLNLAGSAKVRSSSDRH
ncbi:hypothetical protein [Rhizobium sp. NLR22b]|uniref:hypothetical protein n=1 Tax=Rhizobium sp. NLR22b TaxID=2731115 RepID=UPI001C839B11|nr:hypothetical protein [Rhizobium sp. NLR22b]MBX5239502.1 hypothetical protein [Rhizobium sp. NLR22b]